jgi:uncharacterized membrane protein YfcA
VNLPDWAGLTATTFVAAAVQGASGFGFAALAAPFYLLFVEPARAIQLIILLTAALSAVALRGLRHAVAPRLLLRLMLGCLAGLPLGLVGFAFSDPHAVRLVIGATILFFALLLVVARRPIWRGRPMVLGMNPGRDLAVGLVSGLATALVGMSGPPVLVYLMLAGTSVQMVRATLLAFFVLCYAATVLFHSATVGIPAQTWLAAVILLPFALLGGLAGRRLGDRLGQNAFAVLAIGLLMTAGIYTLATAVTFAPGRP